MKEIRETARLAGLLYMLDAIIAPFSLSYVPSRLAAAPGATADHLRLYETMLRASACSEIAYQIIEVFLTLLLYEMCQNVDRRLARQMLVLGLLPIPMVLLNEVFALGALALAHPAAGLTAFNPADRDGLAAFLYGLHGQGLVIASLFWGLWLLPLGRLIRRSQFAPKLLGLSVIIGGLGYILAAAATIASPLSPLSANLVDGIKQTASLMTLGEIPIIPALLWIGFARNKSPSVPAHDVPANGGGEHPA